MQLPVLLKAVKFLRPHVAGLHLGLVPFYLRLNDFVLETRFHGVSLRGPLRGSRPPHLLLVVVDRVAPWPWVVRALNVRPIPFGRHDSHSAAAPLLLDRVLAWTGRLQALFMSSESHALEYYAPLGGGFFDIIGADAWRISSVGGFHVTLAEHASDRGVGGGHVVSPAVGQIDTLVQGEPLAFPA